MSAPPFEMIAGRLAVWSYRIPEARFEMARVYGGGGWHVTLRARHREAVFGFSDDDSHGAAGNRLDDAIRFVEGGP